MLLPSLLQRASSRLSPRLTSSLRTHATMAPHTCKWGILATGGIAKQFAEDLLIDPSTRNVNDVRHDIVAVASSSSQERAQQFIKDVGADVKTTKAYGNYEDFAKDSNIDIVYVATPHSHHYDNVLTCLEAGRHVCCEKPFTVNEKQAAHLFKVAKAKKLFIMEAMWTRFFPLMEQVRDHLHNKRTIGKILRAQSDFGEQFPKDPKHRGYNPDLAGGALLDLGIYPLTWQLALIHEDPDNKMTPPQITSSIVKASLTGVDAYSTLVMNWPGLGIQTICQTNLIVKTQPAFTTVVQGEKGILTVEGDTASQPTRYALQLFGKDGSQRPAFEQRKITEVPFPGGGTGMFYEADAAARALRDGKLEADLIPHATTLLSSRIMDNVRKAGDFKYPAEIEKVRSDA